LQYPTFYQEHPGKNSLASYLTTFLKAYTPLYLSATEVGILKLLLPTASNSSTNLVLKFLEKTTVEESTNTTYGAILTNLADIALYADGILVPKDYIYTPRVTAATNGSEYGYYVDGASTLVQDAHKAGLEVFVYDFANDAFPSSYNYSFDPVLDALSYIGNSFQIDGYLSDFPTTAAEAISEFL
jgi:glycerophosphoryl diester phosphodiesterase